MATNQMKFEEPQQENMDLQDFDDMEVLSLCDLPLDNKASDWDEYYSSTKEEQSPLFDHDFFEFFSEDFTASSTCYNPKDHIMFCGKLITCKEEKSPIKAQDSMTYKLSKPKEDKRSAFFTWRWRSFNKSRTSSLTTKPEKGFHQEGKNLSAPHKRTRSDKIKKMSVLASPIKSRWYLFAFGVGRFPMEMELSDMKTRQSKTMDARRSPPHDSSETTKRNVSTRTKSIWSMLNVLGYRNQDANLVV